MIPSPWMALVLGLAAFRLLRLVSYDTLEPLARARAWILGEEVVTVGSSNARMRLTEERPEVSYRYRRPLLAELVHCAFCLGLWISGAVYAAWALAGAPAAEPWRSWMLYPVGVFALSAFVGLVAKNLDP